MKFMMVILFCVAADMCETIYEQTPYNSQYECQQEAAVVRNYMIETFPDSAGEIYCFSEEEFLLYNEWLKDGNKPKLTPPADA